MRTTSFCKAATTAVLLCCAAGADALAQEEGIHTADTEKLQDLGVSEVSGAGYVPTGDASYTEIKASAWEGKSLTAADLLSSLPGIQAYKQGGLGSFQSVSIQYIRSPSRQRFPGSGWAGQKSIHPHKNSFNPTES